MEIKASREKFGICSEHCCPDRKAIVSIKFKTPKYLKTRVC
jgi:hypothetical protein